MELPNVLTVELTYRCNHKCLFCSCPWEDQPKLKEAELSTTDWKNIFGVVKSYGVEQITFSGGEAILRDDLIDLISYAHKSGFSVGLISNGKNITREFLLQIQSYDVLLSISVPGIDTFAQTTGVDNIESVLALFDLCKELKIKTVANIAVTKKNIGELYENIAFPILHGATYVLLNRFLPGGRGLKNKQYLLSIDEINEMFDTAEEVLSRAGIYGHVGTELPYCIIKNNDKYKRAQRDLTDFCVCDETEYIKFCQNNLKKPSVIVLKKNTNILKQWKNNLASTHFCAGNALFIVDDEADAASLNTLVNKKKQSTINKNLESIKHTSASSIYLEVTGTPQANLLQTWQSGWKPYFIYYFKPGNGYIGGNTIFAPDNKIVRLTDNDEGKDILVDDEFPENGLLKALLIHLVTSAEVFLKGGKVCNFLIHPSMRVADHKAFAEKIGNYLNELSQSIDEDVTVESLKQAYDDISTTKADISSFDNIYSFIKARVNDDDGIKVLTIRCTFSAVITLSLSKIPF